MPSKTVSPVDIVLKVSGSEKLQKLNSSFRDLSKQLNKLSTGDLQKATDDVRKFAAEAGNSEATIKGQIKAFEGLREQAAMGGKVYRELGVSIGNLKSTLRGSTDELEQQRAGFVKTGNAAKSSAADIKAVISQLEVLKGRARPGSSAFAQIAKDIDALQGRLKEVNIEVKKFNASFETSQRPAMSLEKIQRQIGRLSEGMKTLNFTSNEYLETQTRIALLGQVQSRSVGRQQVRANAEMFSSAAFQNFAQGPAGKLGLPNTAAALNLEISELQTQLANTTPGESYKRITQEIASKQADLNKILNSTADAYDRVAAAQSASTRRAQKVLDRQAYESAERPNYVTGVLAPEESSGYRNRDLYAGMAFGAGGYRDPKTGAIIARGRGNIASRRAYGQRGEAFLGLVSEESEILRQTLALPAAGGTTSTGPGMARRIGVGREVIRGAPAVDVTSPAVGMSEPIKKQANALREAATAYKPYNAEIRKAKAANNGSISGINNLKAALERKRNELPTTTAAFKRLTQQIEILDRQSEKASKRMSRRRFSPGKAAQVAGATISGGIFGGPEGFLGGAIGGALGGVGGSFAGAALGAQVGQLRQQLGGFAEYAASIEKLKIALNGIAGDASNYNRALQAAADVTKELNIPQEVAIRGITRLTAAVKGAGGGISDAELAFKNINSAIIATGGGAEQVEGAVTALVQIFSKGKVSAEEINQIAERLPGTFNKIAEASGRTGPELTKALQKGEVGLNDLMKFLVQLGGEYGELAEKIAGSSESAGARLTVAYNKMRIEIGKALQPVGAEFQEAFLEFITDIGPSLVVMAKAVGEGMRFIIQNRGAILTIASFAAKLVAVNFALKAFVALSGPLKLMFALIRTGFRQTTQQASLAATKLARFGATVKTLAASLAAPIVITFAIVGAELVISYFNRIKQAKADLDASGTKPQGEVFFRSIGGTAATKETLRSNFKDIVKNLDIVRARLAKTKKSIKEFKASQSDGGERAMGGSAPSLAGVAVPEDLTSRLKADEAELARLRLNYRTLIEKYPSAPEATKGLTDYGSPTGTDTGADTGTGTGKARKSQLPQLQDRYDSLIRSGPLADIQRFQIANSLALVRAQKDNNTELVYTIKNNAINLDFGEKELELKNKYLDAMNAANKTEDIAERQLQERIAELERDLGLEKLIVSANGELLALKQDQAIASEIIAKASEDELFNLRDQLGLVTNEQRIERFRQSRKDAGDPNAEQQADLFRQTIDPTLTEGLSQNIRSLKKELEDLVNPINQITGAANAIGSAFSQSFTNAISGSKSAKEALADFFKSVASYFLDMAGQIIAKMVTIAVLDAALGLLGGSSGGGGGGGFNPSAPSITGNSLGDFGGGSFGGFRANGGPVTANKPYIVGERGIEVMVPSTSGRVLSNSETRQQLGSQQAVASTREQLGSQQAVASTREQLNNQQAVASTREQLNNQQAKAMQPLDIRYESTVINNVEYVTAEQHRKGMAQAAERGRSLTLSALQGSVKTRKKVGLS
jgi:tape measure domain-containing protein